MIKYIAPFLLSFLLTVILIYLIIPIAQKIKWSGRLSSRHINHDNRVRRVGGLVMVLVFNIVILLNRDLYITPELYGVMAATLAIMIFGFWDDVHEIYWKYQLFFQISLSSLLFIIGIRIYYITNPIAGGILRLDSGPWVILSIFLVMGWIVLLINAINWLDGIDGLSGGVSLISAGTIMALSLSASVNQPPIAILCSIFIGTTLGFLIFNFNPSRIMAGTSGAMFMGFILAILAIFAGTKIATATLVLVVPIIDSIWVILERIRHKKSIFKPDKNHLHFKLLKLGWSQKKIALCYYLITAIIAVIALNTRAMGKSITLGLSIIIIVVISLFIGKKAVVENKK